MGTQAILAREIRELADSILVLNSPPSLTNTRAFTVSFQIQENLIAPRAAGDLNTGIANVSV